MERSLIRNMTRGPLLPQLVAYSIPIILGHILQSLYTVVDMLIIGQYIGSGGLAAAGIGGLMQGVIMMLGMSMSMGGEILLSQQVGAGEKEGISRTIGTLLTSTLLAGIVLGVGGVLAADLFLRILNTPPEILEATRSYYLVCCFGILFVYGYNGLGSILRGLGQSKLPAIFIAISSVLNVALDYLAIVKLHMGVEGAALATVTAQGVSFLIALVYLYRHRESFGFDFRPASFRIRRGTLLGILKVSAPMMVFSLVMSISNMFINSNINVYGVAASAVDGIGNKLFMIANAVSMGLYGGGAAIVGQCLGAGLPERIKKTFGLTIGLSLIFWVITSAVILLAPTAIFGFFTDDPEVLSMAYPFMKIEAVMFLGMALVTGPFALFDGLGRTDLEMWAGLLENLVVKVVCALLLKPVLGVYGYWLGMALAGFTTPICGFLWFFSGRWKKQKRIRT